MNSTAMRVLCRRAAAIALSRRSSNSARLGISVSGSCSFRRASVANLLTAVSDGFKSQLGETAAPAHHEETLGGKDDGVLAVSAR